MMSIMHLINVVKSLIHLYLSCFPADTTEHRNKKEAFLLRHTARLPSSTSQLSSSTTSSASTSWGGRVHFCVHFWGGGPLLCSLPGGSTSVFTSGGSTSMFILGESTSVFLPCSLLGGPLPCSLLGGPM